MKGLPVALLLALLGTGPVAAADAPPHFIYVTHEASGDLGIIDGARRELVATVPVGKRPRGARLSQQGRFLYVALSGSPIAGPGADPSTLPAPDKSADGIAIVDLRERKLLRVLRGVSDPERLVLTADDHRLFIASTGTGTIVVADADSGATLTTLAAGASAGLGLSPDGRHVFVSAAAAPVVTVIDAHGRRVAKQIAVGQGPGGAAFSPDGRWAYVAGRNDASITFIDARKLEPVHTLRLPKPGLEPAALAVSPDGGRLYVATGRAGSVAIVDTAAREVLREITVGAHPSALVLSPDGRWLYSANGASNDVAVVDTRAFEVVARIRVGERPWSVVVGPTP